VSEKMLFADETELLAWFVLRAANRAQAKGTTVRLVIPRAPEVAHDLHMEVAEEQLLTAEEWLLQRGYLAPANAGLTWGTYTITTAGLEWLRGEIPGPLEAPRRPRRRRPALGPLRVARMLLRLLSAYRGGGRCSGPSG
jgi:hypothetical protein